MDGSNSLTYQTYICILVNDNVETIWNIFLALQKNGFNINFIEQSTCQTIYPEHSNKPPYRGGGGGGGSKHRSFGAHLKAEALKLMKTFRSDFMLIKCPFIEMSPACPVWAIGT